MVYDSYTCIPLERLLMGDKNKLFKIDFKYEVMVKFTNNFANHLTA